MKNAKVIIIRGIPGSGKSTFSNKLINEIKAKGEDAKDFEADNFFMKDGKYKFNPSLLYFAHCWCFNHFKKYIETTGEKTRTAIVSNTFTTMKEVKKYLDYVHQNGIQCIVFRMNSQHQNIHDVPEEVLKIMTDRFQEIPNEIIVNDDSEDLICKSIYKN